MFRKGPGIGPYSFRHTREPSHTWKALKRPGLGFRVEGLATACFREDSFPTVACSLVDYSYSLRQLARNTSSNLLQHAGHNISNSRKYLLLVSKLELFFAEG